MNEAGSRTGTEIRIAVPDHGGAVLDHAERARVLHVSRTPRAGRDRKAHIDTLGNVVQDSRLNGYQGFQFLTEGL